MLCKPGMFCFKAMVGTQVPRSAKAPGSLQTHVGIENSEAPVQTGCIFIFGCCTSG